MIDSFHNTQWAVAGVAGLEWAGITVFSLIELRPEFTLAQLVELDGGTFDFLVIEGWHTFDHTLGDCFYATRLLHMGGTLVVGDVIFSVVRRVIDYLKTYLC